MTHGILTAMDSSDICFSSFKLLYASLKLVSPLFPITMIDLGMTATQREYLRCLPGVGIMQLSEIGEPLPFPKEEEAPRWHTWNKPVYMKYSPYPETIWLDVDCICFRPIEALYSFAADHIIVAEDCADKAFPAAVIFLPNKPYTYRMHPVDYPLPHGPFVNTGVLAFHPHRDAYFFDEWIAFTKKCHDDIMLRESISWWDQGTCQYIIEKNNLAHCVLRDVRFNHAGPMVELRKKPELYGSSLGFLDYLDVRDTVIGHFAGYPKPWGNLSGDEFSIDRLQNELRRFVTPYY